MMPQASNNKNIGSRAASAAIANRERPRSEGISFGPSAASRSAASAELNPEASRAFSAFFREATSHALEPLHAPVLASA